MKKLTSNEIRNMWLTFFKSKDHEIINSYPVVPHNDKSLLFNNAGVTPLKSYFDGSIVPKNKRMTSSQKCIRTNDIENVGYTSRHHTLFEMLGNFSIGDYFKSDAILLAFEFLTSHKYIDIYLNLLYFTYYPEDIKTKEKWISLGVLEDHLIPLEYNFWEIGVGPCGPCTEIFYDRGVSYDNRGIELIKEDIENERFIEIWNIVFSQFNCNPSVSRSEYKELPNKNIDTGMGLERVACISQNVKTSFDTDLFMPYIKKIEELSGKKYNDNVSFKIIADHTRTIVCALSDGAVFENTSRGYVIRRLLRRCMKHGMKLGIKKAFMNDIASCVIENYGTFYPKLLKDKNKIFSLIDEEEKLFTKTLEKGEKKLKTLIEKNEINPSEVFKLYDTYGFPIELTLEYLEDENIKVPIDKINEYIEKQRKLSKNSTNMNANMNIQSDALLNFTEKSKFVGYTKNKINSKIIGIIENNKLVDTINSNGFVITLETPFYAESGGQVADKGIIKGENFKANVIDVFKGPNRQHIHIVDIIKGTISKDDNVTLETDKNYRHKLTCNHSCAHLLLKSLKEVLGEEVNQAGNKISSTNFRFDFTYLGKISENQLIKVESLVNEKIKENYITKTEIMDINTAIEKGATALFSEKYDDMVRVVTMGKSKELCGGTHVTKTSDIKKFAIASIENKGSSTYRLTCFTGKNIAIELFHQVEKLNLEINDFVEKSENLIDSAKKENITLDFDFPIRKSEIGSYNDIVETKNILLSLRKKVKLLTQQYEDLKSQNVISNIEKYCGDILNNSSFNYVINITNQLDDKLLKIVIDELVNKSENIFVLLANITNEKISYMCKINGNVNKNCNEIIKIISQKISGKGGGNETFARGGANFSKRNVNSITTIFEQIKNSCK
ncbi:MAG: alanine--tRNA ligase [Bacilli bacterium]